METRVFNLNRIGNGCLSRIIDSAWPDGVQAPSAEVCIKTWSTAIKEGASVAGGHDFNKTSLA